MAFREEIFRPVDPFTKEPAWFSWRSDDSSLFAIRPLCLLKDLDTLYDWVDGAKRRGLMVYKALRHPMIQRHKMLLESSEGQSFLIERNKRPVCQLDISPSQHDELHLSFHTSADDYLLNYILDYRDYQNKEFADVLKFFVSFYYSFPGPGSIYILVKGSEPAHNNQVIEAGFQFCAEVLLNRIALNLYRIDGIPL